MADTKNYQSTSGSSTDARSDPLPDQTGKVRVIEEDFQRLMFDLKDV
jgi:hypothetical protein